MQGDSHLAVTRITQLQGEYHTPRTVEFQAEFTLFMIHFNRWVDQQGQGKGHPVGG